jgi:uroporphyrinogen-III synthase
MHLLLTRPQADSEAVAGKLQELGHSCLIEPLLSIEILDPGIPDANDLQAVLLTSSNGAQALSRQSISRDIPVYTVGNATAATASDAGFINVDSAGGDVYSLTRLVVKKCRPEDGRLLHFSGEDTTGDLAEAITQAGFGFERRIAYRAVTAETLSPALATALEEGALDGVLLYSPRTAATFTDLVLKQGLAECCEKLDLFALSQAVSHATGKLTFRHRHIAKYPSQADLLALLASP